MHSCCIIWYQSIAESPVASNPVLLPALPQSQHPLSLPHCSHIACTHSNHIHHLKSLLPSSHRGLPTSFSHPQPQVLVFASSHDNKHKIYSIVSHTPSSNLIPPPLIPLPPIPLHHPPHRRQAPSRPRNLICNITIHRRRPPHHIHRSLVNLLSYRATRLI